MAWGGGASLSLCLKSCVPAITLLGGSAVLEGMALERIGWRVWVSCRPSCLPGCYSGLLTTWTPSAHGLGLEPCVAAPEGTAQRQGRSVAAGGSGFHYPEVGGAHLVWRPRPRLEPTRPNADAYRRGVGLERAVMPVLFRARHALE